MFRKTRISRVIEALKDLEKNIEEIAIEAVPDGFPERLNVEQLNKGLDNRGKFLNPKYRSKKYATFKQARNSKPPFRTPDLRLTGKYHRAFRARYRRREIVIVNDDSKDARLSAKYLNIKGLNERSMKQVRRAVLPVIRKAFKQSI